MSYLRYSARHILADIRYHLRRSPRSRMKYIKSPPTLMTRPSLLILVSSMRLRKKLRRCPLSRSVVRALRVERRCVPLVFWFEEEGEDREI